MVSDFTGTRLTGVSGHNDCHICLVTSPCSWLTPLTEAAVRIASAVMLNIGPAPLSCEPRSRNRARFSPRSPHSPARCVSTMPNEKASWPAGTGVCVVNTVVRRTSASAASKVCP